MYKGLKQLLKTLRKKAKRAIRPTQHSFGVIVSYPKSGRTWLRVMLDELGVPFECDHDGAATERPFEQLTLCRKKMYWEKHVVFMLRDPRDTVVSFYFQRTLRSDRYVGSMGDFIRDPSQGLERIIVYNLTWLELGADLPAFLPITYEEMSASPIAVLRGIVKFLGVEFPDAEIERVSSNNTFEKMQKREAAGEYIEPYGRMLRPGRPNDTESYKVRRGKIEGYADYLAAKDVAYCDDILGRYRYFEMLDRLMSDRPAAMLLSGH
jgi:hypothetical protein